ncbi:MAG: alanine--tRNA ligase, partial [Desulfurococcales archaeon]|nr:alanine--tRNA ligase [Desulfurococcales archaeon]
MSQKESIYYVRMFKERGYVRRKCKHCGEFFWSVKEREDCGDAPCSDYTFFELSKSLKSLTVLETRSKFLKFFKRKGHEVIEPYPVVARWRDDLYLTIASIILFQPHVTSGLMPPPANPLVVAQPCVRLEDIDSVGYTFGRHLTSFIMGGHHAFNYPEKKVYFTDETVEFATEFFTKEIGIPEEELVFKESWWEGGGNAGPSFEVTAGGLELATLVFMMYDVKGGSKKEMPLKIVDTGYGIERIAWFTQGVPTAFHAIYGDLVSKYHSILNVPEPPKDLLMSAVKHAGRLNPKDLLKYEELKKVVSRESGYPAAEVGNYLDGAVKVYALLDHVKTASLMLADGIVPSNTGEGYLIRLVLRRIFRLLNSLGALSAAPELFELQAKHWAELYPQIKASLNYILDVLSVEEGRFKQLLSRAPSIVRKYVRKGSRGLSEDELIELYDSHGVPPEVVKELASKEGVNVEVPPDFYFKVTSRHSTAPIKGAGKSKLPPEVAEEASRLNPTKLLFHEDPYLKEFKARVDALINGKYLVLDRTAFYPEGGGQLGDIGEVEFPLEGIKAEVIDTQKAGDVVIHVLKEAIPTSVVGEEVTGRIDWLRRFSLMRHHTATHILLGAARKILGEHVWQAGAEKTPSRGRLDITHYKPLSAGEIRRIEELVNRVIDEGRNVISRYMPKYEAEKKYGFRLYEGGVIMKPIIRVVEV